MSVERGGIEAAKKKVLGPAIGLIIDGVITILCSIYYAVIGALTLAGVNPMVAAQEARFQQMEQMGVGSGDRDGSTDGPAHRRPFHSSYCSDRFGFGVVILLGAIKLMNCSPEGSA